MTLIFPEAKYESDNVSPAELSPSTLVWSCPRTPSTPP